MIHEVERLFRIYFRFYLIFSWPNFTELIFISTWSVVWNESCRTCRLIWYQKDLWKWEMDRSLTDGTWKLEFRFYNWIIWKYWNCLSLMIIEYETIAKKIIRIVLCKSYLSSSITIFLCHQTLKKSTELFTAITMCMMTHLNHDL